MNNIKIFQTPDFLSSAIPAEVMPKRFAIATNMLLVEKRRGLLLFNYEPQKWNQWYPFFSSVNGLQAFTAQTYGDLIKSFENQIFTREDAKNRVSKAIKLMSEILGVGEQDIGVKDSLIPSQFWLKYSKTQNMWTLYYMEFLQVQRIDNANFSTISKDIVDFLPLDNESIDAVLASKTFKNTQIVDNTIELLEDPQLLSLLKSESISL